MVFESLHPSLAVTLIALATLILINAAYRFLINQDRAAELKARMRETSKLAKQNPEKAKDLMKETMSQQRELMRMQMKPMLLSFAVVAMVLPYFAVAFQDVEFAAAASEFTLNGRTYSFSAQDGGASIAGQDCALPCKVVLEGETWQANRAGDKIRLSLIVAEIPPGIPIMGGWELGWIWWYILVSIPLAIIVRVGYGIRS
jgi:uncharacterized membrane protein (DUF106 family)